MSRRAGFHLLAPRAGSRLHQEGDLIRSSIPAPAWPGLGLEDELSNAEQSQPTQKILGAAPLQGKDCLKANVGLCHSRV